MDKPDPNKITLWSSEGLCNFHLFPALFTWEFKERRANQMPPTQTAPLEWWWPESSSSCTVEMCKSTISNHQCFLWFCKKKNQSDLFLDNFTHVYNAHWLLLPLPSLVSFLPFSYRCTSHFHIYLIFISGWGQQVWMDYSDTHCITEGNMFHITLPPFPSLANRSKNSSQLSSSSKNT